MTSNLAPEFIDSILQKASDSMLPFRGDRDWGLGTKD